MGAFSKDTEFLNAVEQAKRIGQADLLRDILDLDGLHSAINQELAGNGE